MSLSIVNKPVSFSKNNSCNRTSNEEGNSLSEFHKKLIAKATARLARAEKKAMIFTHPAMKLFTQSQLLKLQKNFSKNNEIMQTSPHTIDFKPVAKLFTPDGACTWLLTELSPDLVAFGLCDLGFGEPEMGYVSLEEIYSLRGKYGLPVERDRWFEADKTLTEYAGLARTKGRITV